MTASGVCQEAWPHVNAAVLRATVLCLQEMSPCLLPLTWACSECSNTITLYCITLIWILMITSTHILSRASSPRPAEAGQKLCVGFHLDSDFIKVPLCSLRNLPALWLFPRWTYLQKYTCQCTSWLSVCLGIVLICCLEKNMNLSNLLLFKRCKK